MSDNLSAAALLLGELWDCLSLASAMVTKHGTYRDCSYPRRGSSQSYSYLEVPKKAARVPEELRSGQNTSAASVIDHLSGRYSLFSLDSEPCFFHIAVCPSTKDNLGWV